MDDINKVKKQLNAIAKLHKMAEREQQIAMQKSAELLAQRSKLEQEIRELKEEIVQVSEQATAKDIHFYLNSVVYLDDKAEQLDHQQQALEHLKHQISAHNQILRQLVQKESRLQFKMDKTTKVIATLLKQKTNRQFNSYIAAKTTRQAADKQQSADSHLAIINRDQENLNRPQLPKGHN